MSCASAGLCGIIDYHQFWLYFGLILWISSPFETSPKTIDQSTMTAPRAYQPYQLMRVRNYHPGMDRREELILNDVVDVTIEAAEAAIKTDDWCLGYTLTVHSS